SELKGYIYAEFEGRNLVRWERVETPARAMVLIDAEWMPSGDGWEHDVLPPVDGAEVRWRYRVATDQREAARRDAQFQRDLLLGGGAHSVKVEEVVRPSTRARAP